jgi:hypothetical protein
MKYPIGIQNFEKIRKEDYLYVDKTDLIYNLASGGSYYFLSRPRRFGKSLLISTLEAYFQGKKELFKGLAVERLEKEWTVYPVLHLDLNTGKYDSIEALESILNITLNRWENLYGAGKDEKAPNERFLGIIRRAYEKTGKPVVILVDEYDKPLLQTIDNEELQNEFRATLKAFYSVLKTQDAYIRFALLTGVTKFSKVSVFSDLNNLEDISMTRSSANICGITETELHEQFDAQVGEMAEENDITKEECYAQLKEYYDGYHFRPNSEGIYNPFSLLNAFKNLEFGSYWFATGTPTFLITLLKNNDYPLEDLSRQEATFEVLSNVDSIKTSPVGILYQSGYLTIKDFDKEFKLYKLGFPNKEVEEGFTNNLKDFYLPTRSSDFSVDKFVNDVRGGDVDSFLKRLQAFLADSSYQVAGKKELYFQNTFFIIFKMMGFYTQIERTTSNGRIDVTIQTPNYIYIIELKLDGSAEDALQQINEKQYALPFQKDERKLYKIGINFSSENRNIDSWKVE